MHKDLGRFTTHINRYQLENFALGIDFYTVYRYPLGERSARVLQLSFLFFNITLTYWYTRDYFPGI